MTRIRMMIMMMMMFQLSAVWEDIPTTVVEGVEGSCTCEHSRSTRAIVLVMSLLGDKLSNFDTGMFSQAAKFLFPPKLSSGICQPTISSPKCQSNVFMADKLSAMKSLKLSVTMLIFVNFESGMSKQVLVFNCQITNADSKFVQQVAWLSCNADL